MSSHITARAARYFVAAVFAACYLGTSADVAASAWSSSAQPTTHHSMVLADSTGTTSTSSDQPGGQPWG